MTLPPGLKENPESGSISLDRPVTLVHATPDAERLIVKMARVSNPSNEDNWSTGPKLLHFLMKEKHWSPFQMANMCVRIETELDVATQMIRHTGLAFQQFSCRYAKTSKASLPTFRRQDTKNRQNSFDDLTDLEQGEAQAMAQEVIDLAYEKYEAMLEAGVAKETARRILPVCTPSVLYANSSVRGWIHYLQVRTKDDTQLEHRLIAKEIQQIFCSVFPITSEALGWKI